MKCKNPHLIKWRQQLQIPYLSFIDFSNFTDTEVEQ